VHATSRLRSGSPKDGSGENLETSTERLPPQLLALVRKLEGKPDTPLEAKGEDAARRGINELVILRGFQLFERIAASVHNAFNRVIASRADKQLLLVTKTVIPMRTASCQVRPLAAMRAHWSIDCAKAWRLQLLIRHVPNPMQAIAWECGWR
jgi:hypothetical protein